MEDKLTKQRRERRNKCDDERRPRGRSEEITTLMKQ